MTHDNPLYDQLECPILCDHCENWFEDDQVELVDFEDGTSGYLCDRCFELAEVVA